MQLTRTFLLHAIRKFLLVNAADMSSGDVLGFTQFNFDLILLRPSTLPSLPMRSLASALTPLVFSPLTLKNFSSPECIRPSREYYDLRLTSGLREQNLDQFKYLRRESDLRLDGSGEVRIPESIIYPSFRWRYLLTTGLHWIIREIKITF